MPDELDISVSKSEKISFQNNDSSYHTHETFVSLSQKGVPKDQERAVVQQLQLKAKIYIQSEFVAENIITREQAQAECRRFKQALLGE